MRPSQRIVRGMFALGIVVALPLSAGISVAQAPSGLDLDAVRAVVPQGFPGEYDLTEADIEFGELVSLFGEDTIVGDFGDGSTLTGVCGGHAYSYDSNGDLIDAAFDSGGPNPPIDIGGDNIGNQAFTAGNPFQVDTEGVVVYFGFMPLDGSGPEDHRWSIKTEGISLDQGGDPNRQLKNRNVGIVDLADDLPGPLKANFKAKISGRLDEVSGLGPCIAAGHVQFNGPFLNVISAAGMALAGLGIFGLLFNSRPAFTWKS